MGVVLVAPAEVDDAGRRAAPACVGTGRRPVRAFSPAWETEARFVQGASAAIGAALDDLAQESGSSSSSLSSGQPACDLP